MPLSNLTMTPATAQTHAHASPPSTSNGNAYPHRHGTAQGHEEHLVSALQEALHTLSDPTSGSPNERVASSASATSSPAHSRMPLPMVVHPSSRNDGHGSREKQHAPTLDISVASDQLYLRGTGVDVEPTLLSGNVVLHLFEPTSIKQIVLVFRGKARVPNNPHDPHVLNGSPNQYIVCNHEWTFLEGEKKHSHTLKAGRHLFPFELRLGGALPSSLATNVNGGASISYKLRATAIRPGFSANLTASMPITLLRTFAPESLEYQQTLEIENTWPEKVMYSLMIPHKAWATGDDLIALVKFASLAKGVKVLSITTHLCETTKTLARGGHMEKTRNVVTRKHEIVNGQAVCVEDQQRKRLHNALQRTLGDQGRLSAAAAAGVSGVSSYSGTSSPGFAGTSAFVSGTTTPIMEGLPLARSGTYDSSSSGGSGGVAGTGGSVSSPSGSLTDSPAREERDVESTEISTSITIPLPPSLTPSHGLDPVIVAYRIRWSVLLANLDGHTSELRCSLPVHILDYSLLEEARAATLVTRRLLFGGTITPQTEQEEEIQLPSYPSHVRDRLAMDVTSFDVPGARPLAIIEGQCSGTTMPAHEGAPMALAGFSGFIQDNTISPFSSGAPLSRVQTQNVSMPTRQARNSIPTPPDTPSAESSRPNTRPSSRHEREGSSGGVGWSPFSRARIHSRANSRANSRAPSPERGEQDQSHSTMVTLTPTTTPGGSRADEVHIHTSNAASRQTHGLFSVTMKPLTGLSLGGFSAPWHAYGHAAAVASHFRDAHHQAHRTVSVGSFGSAVTTSSLGSTNSASTGDLRALAMTSAAGTPGGGYQGRAAAITPGMPNEGFPSSAIDTSAVPDYFTAARTSGGVPPLESLRGLPTYEEAQALGLRNTQGLALTANLPRSPEASAAGLSGGEPQRSFSDTDLVFLYARSQRVR